MGKEIKVMQKEVNTALSQTLTSVQAVKVNAPPTVAGRSQLSSLDEMEKLFQDLLTATTSYQALLTDQLQKTKTLTDSMVEKDQALATGISRGDYR